jgi:hypothetical protein
MNDELCHGVMECLQGGSSRWLWNPVAKPWQKLRSYMVWHFENLGAWKGWNAAGLSLARRAVGLVPVAGRAAKGGSPLRGPEGPGTTQESLALQPGELVEVKSVEEILATLDANRRHKGLRWMTGMQKHCGRQYRVYRRLQRILLESNGELRNMKNTVLLEGVMCDGREFGGCGRSCFHFWREAWLRRVPSKELRITRDE